MDEDSNGATVPHVWWPTRMEVLYTDGATGGDYTPFRQFQPRNTRDVPAISEAQFFSAYRPMPCYWLTAPHFVALAAG